MDFAKLLAAGISGLGLALAILAYRLLLTEQRQVRPRPPIIRATYVFMAFSVILVGFGLASEVLKNQQMKCEPINFGSDFFDILKATRERIASRMVAREYTRGMLDTGASKEMEVRLESGDCKRILVFAERPSDIKVSASKKLGTNFIIDGSEPHMVYGRLCAGKSAEPYSVTLTIFMVKKGSNGMFVAEAYSQD